MINGSYWIWLLRLGFQVRDDKKLYDPYKCWESLCGGRYNVTRLELRKDEQRYDQLGRYMGSARDAKDHVRRFDDVQCRRLQEEDHSARLALVKSPKARAEFCESERVRFATHGSTITPLEDTYYDWR